MCNCYDGRAHRHLATGQDEHPDPPMTLDVALNVMREPTASALVHRDKVVVALYPYGTAHGGTMMVAELTRDNALALYDQLAEAIKTLEAK